MANIGWPSGLQRTLSAEGVSASYKDPVLRTEVDAGPAKARLRYSRPPQDVSGSIICDENQRQILDYFYRITTRYGALRFDFINPMSGEVREYRFKSPPQYAGSSGGIYTVSLELEEL